MKKLLLLLAVTVGVHTVAMADDIKSGWQLVTDASQLQDGDLITFTAAEYTGKASGSNVTYPAVVAKTWELTVSGDRASSAKVIPCQEYTFTDGTFSVEPFVVTLKKSDSNWNLVWNNQYLATSSNGGTSAKPKAKNEIALETKATAASTFTISINSDGSAKIVDTTNESRISTTLRYNANISNPVDITTARFSFYKPDTQQPVYMYRKSAPVEDEETPGEVAAEAVVPQYLLEPIADNVINVMEGAVVKFTSAEAARMSISTTDDAEEAQLPEGVEGEEISWTVPAGIFDIAVKAESPKGTKVTTNNFTVMGDVVTPAVPVTMADKSSKTLLISTTAGVLEVKIEDVTDTPTTIAPMAIENQDWTMAPAETPKDIELSFEGITASKRVTARSTNARGDKSDEIKRRIDPDGTVSGVENVAVDANEAEAVYYDLQGRRVSNPAVGNLYIRVSNGQASKVAM